MKVLEINLENYRTPGSKVFTGRDRGIEVRNNSQIDSLEPEYDIIKIYVPADIRSINPSFLEEYLINIVSKLGLNDFKQKVKFVTSGKYDIEGDLEEAIERILRDENALA